VGLHRTVTPYDEDDVSALVVDVLGQVVAVAAPREVLAELRVALADLPTPDRRADRELTLRATERGFDLRDDGCVVRRGVDLSVATATVVWRLNAIAAESTAHLLLHGGCVAGPRGGAVLLIGGSGAGKSTLTAACVAAGLTYISDELTAVDLRTGRLTPYPKPLGLDRERLVPGSSLGAVAMAEDRIRDDGRSVPVARAAQVAGPVAPAALVFARYEPGAAITETRLDSAWALLALAAHTTTLTALRGTALAWLAGLALAYPARQLTYGATDEAVAVVQRAAAGPGRPAAPARVLPAIAGDTTTVALDEALAVLHEPTGKVHVLNASAADVWRRAAGGATTATARANRAATAVTVNELVRAGLLADAAGT
jgi:hypothetical protein